MYWKTKLQNTGKTVRKFIVFLFHRAKNDTILRVSSSLSYTSLIAIVPLVAIALAIFSAFPGFSSVKLQLQEALLKNFVPDIEQEISQYFIEFVNATGQLTTIGVIGLAITSIFLLSTIENSLNFIFKVYKPRTIKTKITLYWTVITLGPLLLGAAFSFRGYLFTLQKFMPEISVSVFGSLIPSIITMLTLIMVYALVPNKKVSISSSFAGALVAVILFWFLRKGFALVVLTGGTYKTIYGAVAIVPVFLIWMYLAWSAVIFGAVVTAALDEFRQIGRDDNTVKTFEYISSGKTIRYSKKPKKNDKPEKKSLPKEQK